MPLNNHSFRPAAFARWMGTALLIIAFAAGGSARGDVMSLLFLRPAAIAIGCIALFGMTRQQIASHRFVLALLLVTTGYVAIQLIPLPPALWQALPGRALIAEIDRTAGLGQVYRPFSMAPDLTRNALWSFVVPGAMLLCLMRMDRDTRFALLPVMTALGLLSGLVGLLQITQPSGPFYPYDISSFGSATGLFANRNHAAVFLACLLPMLAVLASQSTDDPAKLQRRSILALCAGVALVPLIVVTGSRAGVITAAVGIGSVPLLYRNPLRSRVARSPLIYLAAGLIVILPVLLLAYLSQAEALQRLVATTSETELRPDIWRATLREGWTYWPLGSGIGSFVPVFKAIEPTAILTVNYVNHAHNEFLELWLTGGLPALLLLCILIASIAVQAVRAWRDRRGGRGILYARLASVVLLQLGLASIGDYPLRTPALATVFVIMLAWLFSSSPSQPTQVVKGRE